MILFLILFPCAFGLDSWHRHQDYGIYASCHVMQAAKRVWAGTAMVEVGAAPDDAELLTFDSNVPLWNATIHQAHTAASRRSDVLAALQYDTTKMVVTLTVWKGLADKPKFSVVVPDIQYLADSPAIVVSDDGQFIGVLGVGAGSSGMQLVLSMYHPESSKPFYVWKSDLTQVADARHLAISKDGHIVAFHRDQIAKNKTKVLEVMVVDVLKQKLTFQQELGYSTNSIGLSPDGKFLVVGFLNFETFQWDEKQQTYKQLINRLNTHGYYLYETEVLDSGTFILGLTTYQNLQPRIEVYDRTGTQLWYYNYGVSQKLEDIPYMLSVTDDENYLLVASWGNDTATNPTGRVWDLEKADKKPIWTMTTPGSSFCGDIVHNGELLNVVVGGKSEHANIMGRGGDLFFNQVTVPKV